MSNWSLSDGQTVSEQLRSRAHLFNAEVPVSFPERLVVSASGKAYVLDTDLSTLFTLDQKEGRLKRMCGAGSLPYPSDISVDGKGNVWVLSAAHSKIVKLAPNCQPQEASSRAAAFYLINVGDERPEIEKFVAAYNLQQLSVLFDPSHKVGPQLRAGFLPQCILFDRNNQVLHRWDGIRHFDKSGGSEQLAEFFSLTSK